MGGNASGRDESTVVRCLTASSATEYVWIEQHLVLWTMCKLKLYDMEV